MDISDADFAISRDLKASLLFLRFSFALNAIKPLSQ